jgi:hypothetical protein
MRLDLRQIQDVGKEGVGWGGHQHFTLKFTVNFKRCFSWSISKRRGVLCLLAMAYYFWLRLHIIMMNCSLDDENLKRPYIEAVVFLSKEHLGWR